MSSIFYGAKVQENKPEVPRITQAAALRITRVSLNPQNPGHKKTSLFIKIKNNSFCIATLEKDKIEDKPLDIYLANSEVVTFYAKGKGELHLIGYFDPLDFDSQNAFDQNEGEDEEEEEEEDETQDLDEQGKQLLEEIAKQGKVKTISQLKKKENSRPSAKKAQNKIEENQNKNDEDDDEEEDQDFQLEDIGSDDEDLADLKNSVAKAQKQKNTEFTKEDKKVQNELKRAKDNKISNANIPRVVSRNNSAKKTKPQQLSSGSEDLLNDDASDRDEEEEEDDEDDDNIDKAIQKQLLNKKNLKVENFEGAKKDSSKKKQIAKDEDSSEALDDLLNDQDEQNDDLIDDQDVLVELEEQGLSLDSQNDSAQQDDDQIVKTAAQKTKTLGKFRKAVMQEKNKSIKGKRTESGKKVQTSSKEVLIDTTKKILPNPAEKKVTSSKPIIGLFNRDKKDLVPSFSLLKQSGQGKKKKKRNKKKNKN